MAFVIRPSRPGSVVAEAFRLKAAAERAEKKAGKKPEPEPEPPKSKNAKPSRAKGGKQEKRK